MRRREDLGVLAEPLEKRRPRGDGVEAVQQQERTARAAAQDLELDPPDGESVGHGRRIIPCVIIVVSREGVPAC